MLSRRVGFPRRMRTLYIHLKYIYFFFILKTKSGMSHEMKMGNRGIYIFGALTLFETKLKLLQSCGYEALESEHVVF